ncbi:MAG TPA: hypothetical protein VIK87_12480 [Sphingomonadales bacterium]
MARSGGKDPEVDAPRPEDIPGAARERDPGNPLHLAGREDIPFRERQARLQEMLQDLPPGEEGRRRRDEIERALDMLEARNVTDRDKPEEAPKKTGYRPQEE